MNAPANTAAAPVAATANGITRHDKLITVSDMDVAKHACGQITFWSLSGETTVDAVTASLIKMGSPAVPPEPVSAKIALARAVKAASKLLGTSGTQNLKRGEWAIVSGMKLTREDDMATVDGTQRKLTYNVNVTAKIITDSGVERLEVEGEGAEQIRALYEAARKVLTTTEVGDWLVEKIHGLGGISMKPNGGVYFVPQPVKGKWGTVVKAIESCLQGHVTLIDSMRSSDAVEGILAALTEQTQDACDKMAKDISDGSLGKRALATREEQTAELLKRVESYEALLGARLDSLRDAVDSTRAAVATAALAAASATD